jgi:hypothetical protein
MRLAAHLTLPQRWRGSAGEIQGRRRCGPGGCRPDPLDVRHGPQTRRPRRRSAVRVGAASTVILAEQRLRRQIQPRPPGLLRNRQGGRSTSALRRRRGVQMKKGERSRCRLRRPSACLPWPAPRPASPAGNAGPSAATSRSQTLSSALYSRFPVSDQVRASLRVADRGARRPKGRSTSAARAKPK